MAIAKVELPNGRIATIEIPDGMGMEEAQTQLQDMYDSDPSQFEVKENKPSEQVETPADQKGASSQLFKMGTGNVTKEGELDFMGKLKAAANLWQMTSPGQYQTGVINQFRETGRGTRQLFNKLTGDDEELARLNQEEEAIRARDEAMTSQSPLAAKLGSGAAMLAPMAIPALPVGGMGASLAGRVALGAGAGALSGASGALTPEEEGQGRRELGAIMGGALGGGIPLATAGASKLAQMMRRMDPDDALQRFTKEQLGASRGGENLPAYERVGQNVQDAEAQAREKFTELYAKLEKNPELPPVKLGSTSKISGDMPTNLGDEVMMSMSPTARKVIGSVSSGSTHTSPILDKTGKNIEFPESTTFADVRETIRELRRVRRILAKNEGTAPQAAQLVRIEDALQSDLDTWAAKSEGLHDVLGEAGRIDRAYREEVVPFFSGQTKLGKYGKTGQYDEQTLDRMFMNPQSGKDLKDLLSRVPKTEDDLRQIYGSKLLQARGATSNIRSLEGGTTGEVLLKPAERQYLTTIADKLRDENPVGSVNLGIITKALRMPGIKKAVNSLMGVDPYSEIPKGVYKTQYLVDALRAVAAGQGANELMEE